MIRQWRLWRLRRRIAGDDIISTAMMNMRYNKADESYAQDSSASDQLLSSFYNKPTIDLMISDACASPRVECEKFLTELMAWMLSAPCSTIQINLVTNHWLAIPQNMTPYEMVAPTLFITADVLRYIVEQGDSAIEGNLQFSHTIEFAVGQQRLRFSLMLKEPVGEESSQFVYVLHLQLCRET